VWEGEGTRSELSRTHLHRATEVEGVARPGEMAHSPALAIEVPQ